jgi:hypothetical protein
MKMTGRDVFNKTGIGCIIIVSLLMLNPSAQAQIGIGGAPPSRALTTTSAVPSVAMTAVNAADYLAEDEQETKDVPLRFGVPFEVALNLNNSGQWTELRDGGRIWRLRIESSGAFSINLVYDDFYMPEGARFFIYNENYDYVIGAFTSANNQEDGMFGTQPVPGDVSILEYSEPANVRGQGRLSVMRVVHAYRNMFGYANALDAFGSSGSCNNNVACDTEWDNQERGVVMLLTSGGSRFCSGSLINNANNNGTPYVLTANHCGPGSTTVIMFNYQSPTCTPNQDGPTNQTVSGMTTRFNNATSDAWLMQMNSAITLTYNPYFNGWNANDVATTASVGIHHPAGDVKKISWDNDPTTSTDYLGTTVPGDGTHWRITAWDDGTTEGGSSGSPLFDTNHRITGQLHGGYASCSSITSDYYGKLALSMTLGMRAWLDPANSGIMVLDGYDPNVAGHVVGTVRDIESSLPIEGVLVQAVGGSSTTTNASGAYNLPLPDGTWDINYTKHGYEPSGVTGIVISEESEVTQNISMQALQQIIVLDEGFESGAVGWTHEAAAGWVDNWHVSTEQAYEGTHSYKCGDTGTGTYSSHSDARLLSPVVPSLPMDAQLSFAMRIESEVSGTYPDSAYDGGIIEISVSGGAFTRIAPNQGYTKTFRYRSGSGAAATGPMLGQPCFAGSAPTWIVYSVDLSSYEGSDVQFRFRFGSDNGTNSEGWYVDDILVAGFGQAVPGRVAGVVTYAITTLPLADVLVEAEGGSPFTTTNENGEYELVLPNGSYNLNYSKTGYETHTESGIAITLGTVITRDVALTPLPSVVVPEELTISVVGEDVVLRWADDTNPYYYIYSSDTPDGVFTHEEGSTALNEFTIIGGAASEIRFYYVIGSATP